MCDLATEDVLLILVELGEGLEPRRVLGDQGALFENGSLVLEALVARESFDFGEELVLRDSLEGIGHSVGYGLVGSSAASKTRDISIGHDLGDAVDASRIRRASTRMPEDEMELTWQLESSSR